MRLVVRPTSPAAGRRQSPVPGARILMEHADRASGDAPRSGAPPGPRDLGDPGLRANAHTARGAELAGRGQYREAIEAFREAVWLIPDNAVARNNLGMTLGRAGVREGDEGLLAEAIEQHRMAVRLQPGTVGLHQNLAAVLALADRFSEALAALDEAMRLDPGNPRTRALRSVALLTLGRFEDGWPDLLAKLENPLLGAQEVPDVPRWRGEALPGGLLINALTEGQGDCIQGIRFAAEARRRVGSTVMLCQPPLARLLSRCAGVDRVVTSRAGLPAVQAQIPPLLLAAVFRPTPETMQGGAYLSVDRDTIGRWRPIIEATPGFKVGITWQGNPEQRLDSRRSFRPAELAPLARVAGVSLISLQAGHGADQRADAPFPAVDLGPDYAAGDWLETAAVVSQLDLVIAPDTAIGHLAGALGRPTWLALSRPTDWRWLEGRADSPWYPTMRLFRQERMNDWGPVFHRIAEALVERMAASGRG
jgi:Flp pilus assembly protein TadD